MKNVISLMLIFFWGQTCFAQDIVAPHTLRDFRTNQEAEWKRKISETIRFTPISEKTEKQWLEALWTMQLMQLRGDSLEQGLRIHFFQHFYRISAEVQRQGIETVSGLFPNAYHLEINTRIQRVTNPKIFAMMAHYLLKGDLDGTAKSKIMSLLNTNFADQLSHPILVILIADLEAPRATRFRSRPPMKDLLNAPFQQGKTVVFSLQRHNRDFQGLLIIRKPDGSFVKNADGSLFAVPQLARAASNMKGYLTNGNSPQGILSIQEITNSDNLFIGSTQVLNMALPFEIEASKFYHEEISENLDPAHAYKNLLPTSWQSYFPMYEAFWAGKAGRSEIWAHGTTINPDFYKNDPYFPNTPSLGCLTSSELWSLENGKRLKSDQQTWIDALKSVGETRGFFVIVELDDQQKPVSVREVERIMQK